jgi:serine/threonine protein kinase/FixJ family two-component response regulator
MKTTSVPPADILVVDDNPHNLDLLRTVLEVEGHRVHTASDGIAALRMAQSKPFDLALIDIRMPHMSGYELCERLKESPRTRDVPVIFLSALDDAMDKVRAFESGGADYIVKPFKAAEVMARVGNQLRMAFTQQRIAARNEELQRRNDELLRSQSKDHLRTPGGSPLTLLPHVEAGELFDGKYRLDHLVGTGGFGVVYRATHAVLNRPVALKCVRPGTTVTSSDAARFRLEGISACRVDHPNAVAVWDAGITTDGILYLVMELLEGHTLRAELLEKGPLSVARAAAIASPVCNVLAAAHTAGVIHRDIKPENIFLHVGRDGVEIVKVVDFGIAKLMGETGRRDTHSSGRLGLMVGTPEYMAPERLQSQPYDGRADVYSVGCMLYEMLGGKVPFLSDGDLPWAVATAHIAEMPLPLNAMNPRVPPEIAEIVHAALEKDPRDRPSAMELSTLLATAAVPFMDDAHLGKEPSGVRFNRDAPTIRTLGGRGK